MELAELLLNELSQEDIHSLIRSASEYVQLPIILVDPEYRGITFYPKKALDDPIWDEIYRYNRVSPNIVNQLNADHMMQLGMENTEPYFLNWGFLEKYPRILMNIFDHGRCIGYLAVLTEECTAELLAMVKLIGRAAAVKIRQNQQTLVASPDYRTMFLNMLIGEKKMSRGQLEEWLSYFPDCPRPPCSVVGISQESIRESGLAELKRYLDTFFPGVLSVVRERNLILLCRDRQLDSVISVLESKSGAGLHFGISESCGELEEAGRYCEQAMFALSMCREKKQRRIFYKDVILDYIAMVINKYSARENYIHPAIRRIQKYDEENRTQYLQTLQTYVSELFNAADTVKRLHIHRNTLPHRLKMIETIGEIDLKDSEVCAVLMLNFHIMGLKGE